MFIIQRAKKKIIMNDGWFIHIILDIIYSFFIIHVFMNQFLAEFS